MTNFFFLVLLKKFVFFIIYDLVTDCDRFFRVFVAFTVIKLFWLPLYYYYDDVLQSVMERYSEPALFFSSSTS